MFAADNTHWNEEGNKMVGDMVARALDDRLSSQPEPNAQ